MEDIIENTVETDTYILDALNFKVSYPVNWILTPAWMTMILDYPK